MTNFSRHLPKNILIVNQHFFPEVAATAKLATELATELMASEKVKITVVTGQPSYLAASPKLPRKENYQNIVIHRVFNSPFDRRSNFERLINYLTFCLFATLKVFSLPPQDLVVVMSTPPMLTIIGFLLKFFRKQKIICWVQDLYPDLAISLGVLRSDFAGKILSIVANKIYKMSDAVIAIGECMAENLEAKGIDPNKISVIHNWANGTEIFPLPKDQNWFVSEKKLEDRFVISYSGNLGLAHELTAVFNAMSHFKNSDRLRWLFIGYGTSTPKLENFVSSEKIPNVQFMPYQTSENLNYSLNSCDVSLVLLDDGLEGKLLPCKLYSSMAIGKPIIAVVPENCEVAEIVRKAHCGFVVPKREPTKFVDAIETLMKNSALKDRMGKNARSYFMKNFDYKIATKKYAKLIRNL